MKIDILCSSADHPVNAHLQDWREKHGAANRIAIARAAAELDGGDLLLLISCSEIIGPQVRRLYSKTLVIHASDVPKGRGWSPHVWQIIEGKTQITLSLLEAAEKVDSGDIWQQTVVAIPQHALCDEINRSLFDAQSALMDFAVWHFNDVQPHPQDDAVQATYYPKRTPQDSRIDPGQSLASQFNLIRVCDPVRYPAFFELGGHKFYLRLEKAND